MPDYKFSQPIQPRYADFDMLGHLNNATYLTYFEVARLHYFSEIGWSLKDATNVVAHFDIDFLVPIIPKDEVICSIKTISLGLKSFQMQYELSSTNRTIIYSKAHSVQVCINRKNGRALEIPEDIRSILTTYENL